MADDGHGPVPMTGGAALARALAAHEVGPMFGMGGFQLLPFYEAVATQGLTHHLINDERVGAFAADAYARLAGRPGVCDATLGPGATNLLTALTESTQAGVAVIALTGDAHRRYAGRHMTQEAAQTEMLRPAAKAVLRIEDPERIPETVRRAYTVATSGRPGAVVVDVPEDVAHATVALGDADFWTDPRTHAYPARRARPDAADVDAAAALLRRAQRPLVLAGGGVHLSGAHDALAAFAAAWDAPVAHTISGKGAVGPDGGRDVGLFGRYSRIANDLIAAADCLLVVGCKLGEIATSRYALIPESTPLVHLEIDPAEAGRTARPDVFLWGDARLGLDDLAAALDGHAPDRSGYRREIAERTAVWHEDVTPRLRSSERPISVARLVAELNAAVPADGVLIGDGGFAAHWTALLYDAKVAGRCYLADRGLASIGYGVPGALGASLAVPGRPVVAVTGDGGLNMTLGDLETLRRVGANVTLVVVNNAASGYVKALQHALFSGTYQSSDLAEIGYARVAEAMGCQGVEVTDPDALAATLGDALGTSGPTVVDVKVTRDPGKMLPGVDSRTARRTRSDDRIA